MRLQDDTQEAVFRAELRAWLAVNLTDAIREAIKLAVPRGDSSPSRDWQASLQAAGYSVRSWPTKYGGQDGSLAEDLILFEELARANAPDDIFRVGTRIIGPMLLKLGTEEQKQRLLPSTASGGILWSQGFSEPSSGSDLASLRMRAEPSGSHYLLNGQKVWNTFGHMADYCLFLTRTNTDVPKHKGLTAFAIPLDTNGITIRPIPQMSGRSDFNELFLENVAAPLEAVVGELDGGWHVAVTMLDFERRGLAAIGFDCQRNFDNLREFTDRLRSQTGVSLADDPDVRRRMSQLFIQTRIAVLNNHRFAAMVPRGEAPGAEASIQKLHSTELNKTLYAFGLELVMSADQCRPDFRQILPELNEEFLRAFGFTIGGGTAQIQRNIIAERVLGLPR